MIELRGTSHIASSDLDDIHALVAEVDPDVVALELDQRRLQVLLSDQKNEASMRNPFLYMIKTVQDLLGEQTGAAPGSDMLEAFSAAAEAGIDVALIDQDITVTLRKLKGTPLREKVKFAAFMAGGVIALPFGGFDLDSVPDQSFIHRLLLQFKVSFPEMYNVLIAERNVQMAQRLRELEARYGTVLAFVGAGHVEGVADELRARPAELYAEPRQ